MAKNKIVLKEFGLNSFADVEPQVTHSELEQERVEAIREEVLDLGEDIQEAQCAVDELKEQLAQQVVNVAEIEGTDPVEILDSVQVKIESSELPAPTLTADGPQVIEEVIDVESGLESYCKEFLKLSRRETADLLNKKQVNTGFENYGFETGDSKYLARYKHNLALTAKLVNMGMEAINIKESGFLENLKNEFRTIEGEAAHYFKKSKEVVSRAQGLKSAPLRSDIELSMRGQVMISDIPDLCLENYLSLYKDKKSPATLKSFNFIPEGEIFIDDVKASAGQLKNFAPMGIMTARSKNLYQKNQDTSPDTTKTIACIDKETTEGGKLLKMVTFHNPTGVKIKSTSDAIKNIDEINNKYMSHCRMLKSFASTFTAQLLRHGGEDGKVALLFGLLPATSFIWMYRYMSDFRHVNNLTHAQFVYRDWYYTQLELLEMIEG